jgi:hypothetical protein
MIAFPDPMEVIGPETFGSTFGLTVSSDQYSFTNGNETLDTTYRVRSAGSTEITDLPPAGISMSARRINVGTAAAAGTYDLVVIATSAIETVATKAVTLTIARATQSPVTFSSAAPSEAVVGDSGDAPSFGGGSGTGALLLTSTDTSVCVVAFVAGAWQVTHVGAGACGLSAARGEDANHVISAPTIRSYPVAAASVPEEPVEEPVSEGPLGGASDGSTEESTEEPSGALDDVGAQVSGPESEPTIECTPAVPSAGSAVTCRLSGGDGGSEVTWRASYNPTFAGATFALDAAGEGSLTFVVPAAAFGSPLVLEVIGWGAPMILVEQVGAPVPGSIPAGGGPQVLTARPLVPAALPLVLALLLGRAARRSRRTCISGDVALSVRRT